MSMCMQQSYFSQTLCGAHYSVLFLVRYDIAQLVTQDSDVKQDKQHDLESESLLLSLLIWIFASSWKPSIFHTLLGYKETTFNSESLQQRKSNM